MNKKIFLLFLFVFLLMGISGCNKGQKFIEEAYILDPKEALDLHSSKFEDDPEWKEIENFLHMIAKKDIDTIDRFYLYGSEPGYEKVATQNYGYLPFYTNEEVEIINEIVPKSNTDIRPGSQSINNSNRQASWHFTVDDHEIYQQLFIDEIGWHAGNPEGNNYGIGIEMAVYQGIDLNMAMRNTAKLTAWLMLAYNLEIKDVKRHYDFSGKNCPQVLIEAERWEEFLDLVEIEYYGQKYFSDVEFIWESLSTKLDDEGKIISKAGKGDNVSYRVKVNFNGKKKIYQFASYLEKMI
jgi:hypothetical protein